jgi:putative ABC transport system permease protein
MIYVTIFSAVGILILLIAGMNFMNLATARSSQRSGEVGVRKVVGAEKNQLMVQFLGESFFLTLIALCASFLLVMLFMPLFGRIIGTTFVLKQIFRLDILLPLLAVVLFLGLGAGLYPAFVLSGFKPVKILRGELSRGKRGALMRRILVVGQFSISIVLIIATFVVYRQLRYMKNQPLGFEKNQKLVIVLKDWGMIESNYESVKQEFLKHPRVRSVCTSSGVPGSPVNRTWIFPTGQEEDKGMAFRSLRCDHDFLPVYGIELTAGRHFNKEIKTDVHQAIIINKEGVRAFGWSSASEAVGKTIGDNAIPIIGVTKDFHWWGLQRPIEPLLIRVVPSLLRSITCTVETEQLNLTIAELKAVYNRIFPGDIFDHFFVDTNFDLQYRSEERIGRLFSLFTYLGLFIACLGLFGLAAYLAEQRTKEIGIRKVLGASSAKITLTLTKDFTKWVLLANLIGWPLAYFAARSWLQGFAYRSRLGIFLFMAAGILALVIAVLTVGFQAVRAARSNPVNALKYE